MSNSFFYFTHGNVQLKVFAGLKVGLSKGLQRLDGMTTEYPGVLIRSLRSLRELQRESCLRLPLLPLSLPFLLTKTAILEQSSAALSAVL